MSKTKTPFFSMGASGSVGGSITAQKRFTSTLIREKPLPTYRRTLPQVYQRWLYEDYAYLWRQQDLATRQQYATAGSRFHLTGFQYWMKYHLAKLPDIAGMWHLDAGEIVTAIDFSRNGNDGIILGPSPADGLIDGCLSWDGINDRIRAVDHPSLDLTTALTLDLFLLPDDFSQQAQYLFDKGGFASWGFAINAAGQVQVVANIGGVNQQPTSAGALTQGVWNHFAAVFNTLTFDFYINGVFDVSRVLAPPGNLLVSTTPLIIGAISPTAVWPYPGDLDHIILYNRALDATEILRHSKRRYPA